MSQRVERLSEHNRWLAEGALNAGREIDEPALQDAEAEPPPAGPQRQGCASGALDDMISHRPISAKPICARK